MMGPNGFFNGGMGAGGWIAMGLVFVVFWGLVALGIVLLVRSIGHRHEVQDSSAGSAAALRILEDRFARGEIDADEYARRRQVISSQ